MTTTAITPIVGNTADIIALLSDTTALHLTADAAANPEPVQLTPARPTVAGRLADLHTAKRRIIAEGGDVTDVNDEIAVWENRTFLPDATWWDRHDMAMRARWAV